MRKLLLVVSVLLFMAYCSQAVAGQPEGKGKSKAPGLLKKKAEEGVEEAEKTAKGKADEAKGKAGGLAKQGEAIDVQLAKTEAKHRERVARLERMKDLMKEQGDEKGVARIEKLLAKEDARYERKMTRLRARDAAAAERFQKKMNKIKGKGPKAGKPDKPDTGDDDADDDDDKGAKKDKAAKKGKGPK
jgi:hypothetical protein